MTPFLVVGYGNELRGDDAAGPCVARRVADWERPEVDGLAVHQLTPELAPALAGAEVVVFVDACVDDGEQKVCLRRLEAGPGTVMGHTCDPRWLLALAEALYGRRPEAWLATIPAADFGLGGRLSPTARAGVAVALRQINRLASGGNHADNKRTSPDINGEAIMTPQNPKSGDVVSVRPLGAALAATNRSSLLKTDALHVVRLVLPAGKEIAPHRSAGEATVQCLEGRVAFTVGEVVRELTAGDLLYLPVGETHALRGIEDSSLLVMRLLR